MVRYRRTYTNYDVARAAARTRNVTSAEYRRKWKNQRLNPVARADARMNLLRLGRRMMLRSRAARAFRYPILMKKRRATGRRMSRVNAFRLRETGLWGRRARLNRYHLRR